MNSIRLVRVAVATALALSAASGIAASDYLLEIKGIAGDAGSDATPQTIEVQSFSWGATNPTSVGSGGMSAGKVSMQDMSVTAGVQHAAVQSPREAASGMASGKRAAAPAAGAEPQSVAPKVGDVATLTVMLRESPTKASTGKAAGCTPGEHIKDVVLAGQGRRYEMHDVIVSSCAMTADGMRRKELTGHVTLIK